ncbi:class I SAM-dependent methyltransferase [Aliiglaciecola sp. LCG003]|uniref:class I SAM-dependent methyltransferase n=1 Tax=Aliiglaciecola sp. LCG003 TaxID=3053655 RepID=UPI0025737261|nr:class I SAM-dependent methyltransferase [Aliiglaciecola sp. LCG003]WJG08084.1 class I SAM-dependent methyltransferase [Aliiglaciecola sp. LCG003]
MSASNITYYSKQAESLSAQYDNVSFTDVHSDWLTHLPDKGWALDVGAGSGRDAAFLADKGLSVVAVEPAEGMRSLAREKHSNLNIHWLDDTLPELQKVFALQIKFDLILLSAVWMHIAPSNRERAFRKLSTLLKPNGKLVISLRHGECHDERVMYEVSTSEQAQLASKFGLSYELATSQIAKDKLGRDDVSWQTVVLTLPDNGTGAFPLIRNIVVNDNKASTYKLALLRALLRIAEGHPGAVISQTDDCVELPLGLVSLYWMKLYKPLVDTFAMQQNSNSKKGLGFIKENGWQKLTSLANNDLYVGASYSNSANDFASSLHQTLKDISNTIKDMPVKYITLPGTQDAVFSVQTKFKSKPKCIMLDNDYLASFGSFYLPKPIWDAMAQFSVWIEPALLNEWVAQMEKYSGNKNNGFTRQQYFDALRWDNPHRNTTKVRKRIDALLAQQNVHCVWSGKRLSMTGKYAVDHAIPFARWPNNDLWNLLPSNSQINIKKSDKLPSASKLNSCRSDITHWWQSAWQDDSSEFFTQASFALPMLSNQNRSFDDVFEAFSLQRDRLRDLQQLTEWY